MVLDNEITVGEKKETRFTIPTNCKSLNNHHRYNCAIIAATNRRTALVATRTRRDNVRRTYLLNDK